MARAVSIKGTREGLTITFGEGDFGSLCQELKEHLERQGAFFRDGVVALDVGERRFDSDQLAALRDLLSRHVMILRTVISSSRETQKAAEALGLRVVAPTRGEPSLVAGQNIPAQGEVAHPAPEPRAAVEPLVEREVPSSGGTRGLILRRRVRAGQVVHYSGSVLVIGDVNAGAEIVAGGDVVIWGRLRGVVHAGYPDDTKAVVCALDLAPLQLRIGNLVARPEDAPSRRRNVYPEIAYVRDGMIVVERWDSARWED